MPRHIPKIIFRRSEVYDRALARTGRWRAPSEREMDRAVRKVRRAWERQGDAILRQIASVTGLAWHEKEIVCYITYGIVPYSDPVTLNPRCNIHDLTHELIHRILSEPENLRHILPGWRRLMTRYQKETETVRQHIVVHAIHELVLLALFNENALERERRSVPLRAYQRAWALVARDGAEAIVDMLYRQRSEKETS